MKTPYLPSKRLMRGLLMLGCIMLMIQRGVSQENITQANFQTPFGVNVNTFSGNVFLEHELFSIPAPGIALELTFYYNSERDSLNEGFGMGWTMNYHWRYTFDTLNNLVVLRPDGRTTTYAKSGPAYVAPTGTFDTAYFNSDTLILRSKYGMERHFADSTHKKLTSIVDPNSNSLSLSYNPSGELINVTGPKGRSISLIWSGGFLQQVLDANGNSRQWQFIYSGPLLIRINHPLSYTSAFSYNSFPHLEYFVNRNGDTLYLQYHPNAAAKRITVPAVNVQIDFTYNASTKTTEVSELVGGSTQITQYMYDGSRQMTNKVGNCCGYNMAYTYDADRNVNSVTDGNGYTTFFIYGSQGNLLVKKDPNGDSIKYEYEPVFCQATKEVDKKGFETRHVYDSKGNLIRTEGPQGHVVEHNYNADGTKNWTVNSNGDTTRYGYDSHGNRNQIIQPDGVPLTATYDLRGNMLSQTNGNGHTTNYEYDLWNRLTKITDPMPFVYETRYEYNGQDKRTKMTDHVGYETRWAYDALGRLIRESKPEGVVLTKVYDQHNLVKEIDPNGNVTTMTYDSRDLMTSRSDSIGGSTLTTLYTYDPTGNLSSKTSPRGLTTTFAYDALNRLTTQTNPIGGQEVMAYDPNDNITSVTDEAGRMTHFEYDSLDRRVRRIDPTQDTTEYQYDQIGNRTRKVDAKKRITIYEYDQINRMLREINPLGDTTWKYIYDNHGNTLRREDANGVGQTRAYDELNRVTSETNDASEVTSYSYDSHDWQISMVHPNGNQVTLQYDSLGRVKQISDSEGLVSRHEYDFNSNEIIIVDGTNDSTRSIYDAMDRKIHEVDPKNDTTTWTYDANGNMTKEKDRNGPEEHVQFDSLDRKSVFVDGKGDTTSFGYDAVGNLTSLTDANNNTTTYQYDALNRRTIEVYPDGNFMKVAYDKVGNISFWRAANDDTTFYIYDALDRMTRRDVPGPNDDNFQYDAGGRLSSASNSFATIIIAYDAADRRQYEVLNGETTSYVYDIPNRDFQLTYPGGRQLDYSFDGRNYMDTLLGAGGSYTLAYMFRALDNQPTGKTYGNGVDANYTYNDNGWVTDLTIDDSGIILWDVNYDHDAEGNRRAMEKSHLPTASETYQYDGHNQLKEHRVGSLNPISRTIPAPTGRAVYKHDPVGNRDTIYSTFDTLIYIPNSLNQYSSIVNGGTVLPGYDAKGNMTFDGNYYYSYDAMNQITRVSNDSAGMSIVARYEYDPLGRRIHKIMGTDTIKYYYDDIRVIEEWGPSDTTTFVYGFELDEIISLTFNDTLYYCHTDAQGSVVALTDTAGNVAERYIYDAYGTPQILSPLYVPRTQSIAKNPYLFTGRRYDQESGLYYYRARYYSPTQGRFCQRDPLGPWDGPNLYTYVGNNPVNWWDPYGTEIVSQTVTNRLAGITTWRVEWRVDNSRCTIEFLKCSQEGFGGGGLSAGGKGISVGLGARMWLECDVDSDWTTTCGDEKDCCCTENGEEWCSQDSKKCVKVRMQLWKEIGVIVSYSWVAETWYKTQCTECSCRCTANYFNEDGGNASCESDPDCNCD